MKRKLPFYIAALACFFVIQLNAQTTVLSGISSTLGLAVDGDNLYFNDASGFHMIDLTQTTPSVENIFTQSNSNTIGMNVYDNKLYCASEGMDEVFHLDLTETSPSKNTLVSGHTNPEAIIKIGDIIYFCVLNSGSIYQLDTANSTATPQLVLDGLAGPTGMCNVGNKFYVADLYGSGIYSFDITDPANTLTLEVTDIYVSNLVVSGNYIYYLNLAYGDLRKVDLNDPTSIITVHSGLNSPFGIAIQGNTVYYSDAQNIFKTTDNSLLNTSTVTANKLKLYPNPASSVIYVSNLKANTSYSIFSIDGKQVQTGVASPNTPIHLDKLNTGMYIIKTANGLTQKISKL